MTIAQHIDHQTRRKSRKKVVCINCATEFTWWEDRLVVYSAYFTAPTVDKDRLVDALRGLTLTTLSCGMKSINSLNQEYALVVSYRARGNWTKDIKRKVREAFSRMGFDVPKDWEPRVLVSDVEVYVDPQPAASPVYMWG